MNSNEFLLSNPAKRFWIAPELERVQTTPRNTPEEDICIDDCEADFLECIAEEGSVSVCKSEKTNCQRRCDFTADDDDDGVPNGLDNCRYIPNTEQADCDKDGIGSVCDEEEGEWVTLYDPWQVVHVELKQTCFTFNFACSLVGLDCSVVFCPLILLGYTSITEERVKRIAFHDECTGTLGQFTYLGTESRSFMVDPLYLGCCY